MYVNCDMKNLFSKNAKGYSIKNVYVCACVYVYGVGADWNVV